MAFFAAVDEALAKSDASAGVGAGAAGAAAAAATAAAGGIGGTAAVGAAAAAAGAAAAAAFGAAGAFARIVDDGMSGADAIFFFAFGDGLPSIAATSAASSAALSDCLATNEMDG